MKTRESERMNTTVSVGPKYVCVLHLK